MKKKYVRKAKVITTVSQLLKKQIFETTKHKNIEIIQNGYENVILKKSKTIKQYEDELNIGFVGTIYKYHPINQVLETLFFLNKKNKIILNIYGNTP